MKISGFLWGSQGFSLKITCFPCFFFCFSLEINGFLMVFFRFPLEIIVFPAVFCDFSLKIIGFLLKIQQISNRQTLDRQSRCRSFVTKPCMPRGQFSTILPLQGPQCVFWGSCHRSSCERRGEEVSYTSTGKITSVL